MRGHPLRSFPPGTMVFTQESIGDDLGNWEVREVYYYREAGREVRYPYNVPVARLGIAQGTPGEPPRYLRVCVPACRDPGEADGRVLCYAAKSDALSHWRQHLGKAIAAYVDRAWTPS